MQVRKEMKHFDVRVIKYVTPHSCILIFFSFKVVKSCMFLTMNAAHAFMVSIAWKFYFLLSTLNQLMKWLPWTGGSGVCSWRRWSPGFSG